MSNELRIEIITDSDGNHVSLDNIPIEAAESLQVFIHSLTELAKTFDERSNVRLKLENNSVDACLVYDEIQNHITNSLDEVITNNSNDNHKIQIFKNIQDRIQLNGLQYRVYFKKNNQEREVTPLFEGVKFTKRRRRFEREYKLRFIRGTLFEAGGKSHANVHLENKIEGEEYKISCTKEQARKLNQKLYSEIFLAVTENKRSDNSFKHYFVDSYLDEQKFLLYKSLHDLLEENTNIEKYDLIYNHIQDVINDAERSNAELIKLMRLYNNSYTDKGIIRTILMTIKPILRTEEDLYQYYNDLSSTLRGRSKTGKI